MAGVRDEIRPLQIIGAALISGPAIFLAIVIFLRSDPDRALVESTDRTATTVTWTSLAVGLAVIGTSLVLPRPKGSDLVRIRGHFIARLALVEGGALFATVAYLIEGRTFSVGFAVFCLAVMAALHFPTRARVEGLLAERT